VTDTPPDSRPAAPRGGDGRFLRSVDNIDRDRRACELHTMGWTYQQIADHLGYAAKGDAWKAVQLIRRETAQLGEHAEQIRQRQLAEIAEQRRRLWHQLENPAPAVDRLGRVCHDDNGNVIYDGQAIDAAHALLIRLSEREARIRGTDAPKRSISLTGRAGPEELFRYLIDANPADVMAAVDLFRRHVDEEASKRAIAGTIESQ
jgi:hypothetical protein